MNFMHAHMTWAKRSAGSRNDPSGFYFFVVAPAVVSVGVGDGVVVGVGDGAVVGVGDGAVVGVGALVGAVVGVGDLVDVGAEAGAWVVACAVEADGLAVG